MDISWNVSEAEYRADPALSYSTLAKYSREGFSKLDTLFEHISTPSLSFGSAVDAIITGGEEEFNNNFIVFSGNISDSGKAICDKLYEKYSCYPTFAEIPEAIVSNTAKEVGFWQADKWDNRRYSEVLKTGKVAEYYNVLYAGNHKTIISMADYEDVIKCVRALRESESTASYFHDNDEFSPIQRYYQLKFKATFKGVNFRCMADLLIVDYEKKVIIPCDLKTSSHVEWEFEDSFKTWRYMIQARLYWNIIRANLNKDDYFKDFALANYRFIVVCRKTVTPLVWKFPYSNIQGSLIDSEGNEYKDPISIGVELRKYLDLRPAVPNNIYQNGYNVINCLMPLSECTVKK